MNILKKVIVCIVISIVIQSSVLFYLDKILFKESTQFVIETVDTPIETKVSNIYIPSDSENIKASFNGNFITYFQNGKLKIVNTTTGETKEILNGTNILSVEWVPKNNTLFLVENKHGEINTKTYNATNEVEQDICKLANYNENDNIQSFISLSTEYVSITNRNNTTIYRVDIEKERKKISDFKFMLGTASVSPNKDLFYFEDFYNKEFYQYSNGSSKKINLQNTNQLTILKAIGNTLYIGEYSDDNKISKIIYGESISDMNNWKTQVLNEKVDKKDIYISSDNQIYINNNLQGMVTNITTGENIQYDDKFLFINDKVLCTIKNNYVYFINLNDS